MKIKMHTDNSGTMILELKALPLVGHYIHYQSRIFLVESVVHEEGKLPYLSTAELVSENY